MTEDYLEFYPTPKNVINKMLEPYKYRLENYQILEPSAGNGAIVDYISEKQLSRKTNIYCIESNPDFIYTLQGKGYSVVGNDFLNYYPYHDFSLIVMNPPFSNGDAHLLHAWEILNEGDIVCLLNAETIKNPYSKKRKLLANIIAENGSVEMLGQCFQEAERPTDVEVALVRLHKKDATNRWKIDFESKAVNVNPDFSELIVDSSAIATNDQINAYLNAWYKTREAAVQAIKSLKKLDFYINTFMKGEDASKLIHKTLYDYGCNSQFNNMAKTYNELVSTAQASAWRTIISKLGFEKYMTSGLKENFTKFCTSQGAYDLNRENIQALIQFICLNIQNIMQQAVVDVYDKFTKYYNGNTTHTEGWKTNSAYKVNKKIILPNCVEIGWYRSNYSVSWDRQLVYADIDKVMCWLSGLPFEKLDQVVDEKLPEKNPERYANISLENAVKCVRVGDSSWHESHFWRFRCFKKGTLHIEFKDEALWARFNLVVNEGKNQIGNGKN